MENVANRVSRCKVHRFLLEATVLHGYSLVTRWLLVHALLQLFDVASHKVPN